MFDLRRPSCRAFRGARAVTDHTASAAGADVKSVGDSSMTGPQSSHRTPEAFAAKQYVEFISRLMYALAL